MSILEYAIGIILAAAYILWAETWKWPKRLVDKLFEYVLAHRNEKESNG